MVARQPPIKVHVTAQLGRPLALAKPARRVLFGSGEPRFPFRSFLRGNPAGTAATAPEKRHPKR